MRSVFAKKAICCPFAARACLANQVCGEEAAKKPFLDERLATREANKKMVLEPLAYLSDTPWC
ncbi:hypothetical protein [Laceyella sacchari]|uniref:hypothetical protein n=1 Tax=Laceyella sacchari TaxID=37482 RepID=UPI00104EC76B|nr:hypothetical protein [Laceyella sacchari]